MNRLATMSVVAFGLASTLVACDEKPTGPEVGSEFALSVGETATLDAVHTTVRFLAIAEDSRCPSQAQCVWAGDGAVVLEIAPAGGDEAEETVHTNPESGPGAVVLAGYELTLLRLDPYPVIPGDIESDAYRATLALHERLEPGSD